MLPAPPSEPRWLSPYLCELERTGRRATAAKFAGVAPIMVARYLAEHPEAATAVEEAEEYFNDTLEAEALRRAKDGYDEPVFHQGVKVGTRKVYSDQLMTLLLKGRRKQYRDKQEVKHDHSVTLTLAPVAQMPPPTLPATTPPTLPATTPHAFRTPLTLDQDPAYTHARAELEKLL